MCYNSSKILWKNQIKYKENGISYMPPMVIENTGKWSNHRHKINNLDILTDNINMY